MDSLSESDGEIIHRRRWRRGEEGRSALTEA